MLGRARERLELERDANQAMTVRGRELAVGRIDVNAGKMRAIDVEIPEVIPDAAAKATRKPEREPVDRDKQPQR